ncbi:MAG: SDR family oxidoreductase [Ignavibacteria bacterium]
MRVIWITGASTGIGFEIAKVFAKEGYSVVATGRRKSRLVKLISEIKFAGFEGAAFVCNVQSERSVFSTKRKILEKYGTIDLLINNAGITVYKSFLDTKTYDFDNVIYTNLRGAFLTMKSVLPLMMKKKKGHIINILSVAVNTVFRDSSVYTASKAALYAMTNVLRDEIRNYNIKISNVMPGNVDTPMWDMRTRQRYHKRMMTPREVAELILAVANQPKKIVVEDIIIRPIKGDL